MASKRYQADSDSDMEDGGAKLSTPMDEVATPTDAMEIDSTPAPVTDKRKAAADARAERAARRKQRKEELAAQGLSKTSSMASTPNPESEPASPTKIERKPRKKKTEKKSSSKKPEKEKAEPEPEAETKAPTEPAAAPAPAPEVPAPAPAGDAEPLPFVIDVKPTKVRVEVADTDTTSAPASEKGTSVAPSSVNGDGLNRAARRRLMQIDRQRLAIKKELNMAADSDERQDEVDKLLAVWTTQFDEKAESRAAKKRAKKDLGKGKSKGKLLTGRNNYEKQKQIKKQKRKEALRLRQEAVSGKS